MFSTRTVMSAAAAAVTVLFLTVAAATTTVSLVYAQTVQTTSLGSSILDVDKTRLWLRDRESAFRQSTSNAPPLPRYANTTLTEGLPHFAKHSALYVKGSERIVVFGGELANSYLKKLGHSNNRALHLSSNRMYVFDIPSNQWYEEPTFSSDAERPAPRMHHAAWLMADGQTMIVHGGIGDDARPSTYDAAFSDIWRYRNRSWTKVSHQAPQLYGHSAVAFKNKVYVFGGTSGRTYSDRLYQVDLGIPAGVASSSTTHHLINVSFKEIAATGDAPRARAFHAAAISESKQHGDEMLVFGGHDGLNAMDDLYSLNLKTHHWTFLGRSSSEPVRAYNSLDTGRVHGVAVPAVAHHSCSAMFPIMLCIGGSNVHPLVNEYDLSLRRWLQSFTRNASLIPLLDTRTFIRTSDETGVTELWAVGGLTGANGQFSSNSHIVKTSIFTEQCPANFVNPDFSSGRCLSCPIGTIVSMTQDPHRCLSCPNGTYASGGFCKDCPAGTYNPVNSSTNVSACLRCPPGRFTLGTGAGTINACIVCPIGTYADSTGAQCLPCPAGTFGFTDGGDGYDGGCQPCKYGTYSTPGSIKCEPCPLGTSGGPYIERAMPNQIELWRMNTVVPPATSFPATCPTQSSAYPTTVVAGTWFYVAVVLGDSGGPNGDGSIKYSPMRDLAIVWPGAAQPLITVEYDGTPSRMYENCRSQTPALTGCLSLARNQTSVGRTFGSASGAAWGFCGQWWRWMAGFSLRFDDPTTEDVTVTLRSGQVLPLVLKFKVVAFGQAISVATVKPVYVASQRITQKFTALDLLNRYDPTASDLVSLAVTCSGGPAPTLFVNGGLPTTITFSGGIVVADLSFSGAATGCTLSYTRNGATSSAPGVFDIQSGVALQASTGSVNMTNGGFIQVECQVVDAVPAVVTGDDSSILQLTLLNNSFTQYWKIATDIGMRQTVIGGIARWIFQIYSAYPVPSTVQNGVFRCTHLSGITPLLPPANSPDFFLNGKVNGTELRLNTDFGSGWPSVVAANETFKVHIERYDPISGAVDGTVTVMLIHMELISCPGVRLKQQNTSSSYVRLIKGRATVSVKFTGGDRTNCLVLLRQADQPDPERRLKSYWTPPFNVATPTYLSHNGCAFTACATCTAKVGRVVPITVTVHTANGAVSVRDNRVVIQMQLTGNSTGAIEVNGKTEQLAVNGTVTFNVMFLPSTQPVGLLFYGGVWKAEPVYNTTYYTAPVFKAVSIKTGEIPVFYRSSIKPVYTCPMPIDRTATRMRLLNRVPRWIPSGAYFPVSVEAVTDFGDRAVGYTSPYTISVVNCAHGLSLDTSYGFRAPPLVPTETPVVNFVTGSTFSESLARFEAQILFGTQTRHERGMYNCSLRVHSGTLPSLVIEGFEVHRVFRSCRACAPGTWSPGGNGTNLIVDSLHPGGCAKCMIGTFATVTGAASESECQVCSPGDGYRSTNYQHTMEGATSCASCGALNISAGLPGGGSCPAGNTVQLTSPQLLDNLFYGRLGRLCTLAQCINSVACPNGQFRLTCSSYFTQANCLQIGNGGQCNWNSTTNTCSGPTNQCMLCPPGTVGDGPSNGAIASCRRCPPGQYSENWGHTGRLYVSHSYSEYRCDAVFPLYNPWCTGAGTGICPNGTIQPNFAAGGNGSCITCPAGTYAHHMPIYVGGACGSAANAVGHNAGEDTPPLNGMCPQYARTGSCFRFPLNRLIVGAVPLLASPISCTSCPAGTYNPKSGRWDPSHCKPCRAGTYCPTGSAAEIITDVDATDPLKIDLTGFRPAPRMSFEQAGAPMDCGNKWTSDYPGYLQDGHFSNYKQRYYNAPNLIGSAYKNHWWDYTFEGRVRGSKYARFFFDPRDRLGATNSGSVRCNATGCVVFQNVSLRQEIPEDLVARIWVYIDPRSTVGNVLYPAANISQLYNSPDLLEGANSPFAGLNVTLYSHHHTNSYSSNTTWFAKAVDLSTVRIRTWAVVEVMFRPEFPVAVAEFKLEAHGFYNAEIYFDDAVLRPAGNRICNCSTGFYYNASNPSRRCMPCPPGFMCAGAMLRRCVNAWSTSHEPGCHECRPNWMCDADGRGRLIACPVGTYKSNATETCEKCLDGHACQDGFLVPCNSGRFGDGGVECYMCAPGTYSLTGGARSSCTSCPAGTTSNAMRTGCVQCQPDHYSPDGSRCYECPAGSYQPLVGQASCRPCDALFLQTWNYTVYRNSQKMLNVLPVQCACLPDLAWRVEAVHQISGATLGEAARSLSTKKTIRYTAGPRVGVHLFRVHLTSNDGATLQVALIEVTITNRAPVAQDDMFLELVHPTQPITYNLTHLLFNDYDPDLDVLYFATLTTAGAQYGATNLQISPDRRTASVDLPTGFTGPAQFQYTIMDEFHASPATCLPPSCSLSNTAQVVLFSRRVAPVAVNDRYDVLNGLVYSLDVTANDIDVDGDDIFIVATTPSTYGAATPFTTTCTPGCAAACRVPSCTCAIDPQRNMCWPSNNRPNIISYTAPPTICGTDSFTYTIRTSDGQSTATVYPRIRRCYCADHSPPVYFNFIVDGTTDVNAFSHQLGFVDAVQKRTLAASGDFRYGIFVAGVNQVLVPFQSSYIRTQDLLWPNGMQSYPFNLGEALNESATLMNFASLPPSRIIANVIVMGHESNDDVVPWDAIVKGAYSTRNYVVSISPSGTSYVNANLLNPLYRNGFKTFKELITTNAAQDTIDEICAL